MQYVSTRGQAPALGFLDATLAGLARDGGLYTPAAIPQVGPEAIRALAGLSYAEAAARLVAPFVGDDLTRSELDAMAEDAYRGFRHAAKAPLVQIDDNLFLLELFHGPTLAFKDFAMQWLGRLVDHALAWRDRRAVIVGATSGDTGAAAIEAFGGGERTEVFILYPHGRVSDVQRRQMTTIDKPGVHAIAIEGSFDDCQNIVKALFNDLAFRDELGLTGVNSINWARILAQIVYYFTAAASRWARPIEKYRSPCRPAILAIFWRAITPSGWGCRSSASWSPPTRTTFSRGPWPAAYTSLRASSRRNRRRWTSKFPQISSGCCSRPMAAMRGRCER